MEMPYVKSNSTVPYMKLEGWGFFRVSLKLAIVAKSNGIPIYWF